MALLVRECGQCRARFEVLTTVRHSLECPKCGSEAHNVPQPFADRIYTDFSVESRLTDFSQRRRKAQLDARDADLRSGDLVLDDMSKVPAKYQPEFAKEKHVY
jgi:hypothetical protein